jgi:EAL and modified HD-GYP domain-containing signal transduction protein
VNNFGSIWRRHKRDDNFIPAGVPAPAHSVSPAPETSDNWRFIARQAIFDQSRNVFGYELLARSGWENRFVGDSDAATRKMISDGVLYGFGSLTRGRRAFVNCTRESLLEGLVTLLPTLTVLEILETIVPDAPVIEACRSMKQLGYQIALDDFTITPNIENLVELADFVKVDFRCSDRNARREIIDYVKGSNVRLLAEKVETEEEFRAATDEGFELFQGYFFCHPAVFMARQTPTSGANYFRLFAAISQRHIDFGHVADLLKSEVTICYQLLRMVNSAGFGLNQPVQSVQGALMLVGEDQFRKLVLNAIAVDTCSKHPDELLIRVLQRARFLELMSPFTGESPQEQYLFGLLTLMRVMLDSSVQQLIRTLPLRNEVKEAMDGKANSVSAALRLLDCYERGDWTACMERSNTLQISESKLAHLYEESLRWAESAVVAEPMPVV